MEQSYYRFPDVAQRVRLSRTTIWRLERAGLFPARRKLSASAVGWLREEVEEWINSRDKVGGRS